MVQNYRKVYVLWFEDYNHKSQIQFIGVYSGRKNALKSLSGFVKYFRSLNHYKTILSSNDEFIFSYEDKLLGSVTLSVHISEVNYNNFITSTI